MKTSCDKAEMRYRGILNDLDWATATASTFLYFDSQHSAEVGGEGAEGGVLDEGMVVVKGKEAICKHAIDGDT